jgi:CDP-6-deoxy-D-xylo-4-hexulose-3-dehydrase
MYWPLMEETITLKDRLKMAKFILTTSRLTNGPRVHQFEKEWSEWVGTNHSLYVGNGSLANFPLGCCDERILWSQGWR